MVMSFYPDDAPVPDELRTTDLLLRMLTPEHVHLDYEAVIDSQDQLLRFSNGSWPVDGFTLAENLEDLERHAREHRAREAFTYTVMNPDATRCEGCVYINPWEQAVSHRQIDASMDAVETGEHEAVVTFWIRSGSLERDLDRQLVSGLLEWFERDWPFRRIVFMTNDNLPHQVTLLREAGLQQIYSFGSVTGDTSWLFFAP
jgi:hypothetical protein